MADRLNLTIKVTVKHNSETLEFNVDPNIQVTALRQMVADKIDGGCYKRYNLMAMRKTLRAPTLIENGITSNVTLFTFGLNGQQLYVKYNGEWLEPDFINIIGLKNRVADYLRVGIDMIELEKIGVDYEVVIS